jgi:hypothetical protein
VRESQYREFWGKRGCGWGTMKHGRGFSMESEIRVDEAGARFLRGCGRSLRRPMRSQGQKGDGRSAGRRGVARITKAGPADGDSRAMSIAWRGWQ